MGYYSGWYSIKLEKSKTSIVALSTAESEYMAAYSVSKECCYLKSILEELKFPNQIRVYCDSTAALSMIRNPVQR